MNSDVMIIKKPSRYQIIAGIAVLLVAAGSVVMYCMGYLHYEKPIEGGILAYKGKGKTARMFTQCMCGNEGYYIFTDKHFLWYVTGHDEISLRGDILERTQDKITYLLAPISENTKKNRKTYEIEIHGRYLRHTGDEEDYKLFPTWLGPDMKKRIEEFDSDEKNE